MTYKLCLLSEKDASSPINLGYTYIKQHQSDLVDAPEGFEAFVAAGWTQGVDFAVYNDKVYMFKKDYVFLEDGLAVILAIESTQGCDVV